MSLKETSRADPVEPTESLPALLEELVIPESLREAWARVEASQHRPRMKRALARVAAGCPRT